jgi:hypothetical protein
MKSGDLMADTLTMTAVVQKGHRIELVDPTLPEGQSVLIHVMLAGSAANRSSLSEFIRSLPPGTRTEAEWVEFDRQFRLDRDAWDREP